jgi:3-oxo-4-pregnene-20-carboxyl-CoA dehydrogenase beta subunit
VFVELSAAQRTLQTELRRYFAGLVSPEQARAMLTERHGPTYRDVIRRMGRDGWLGVGWPVEYGGRGFGALEQTIFVNEAARRDIPLPYVTLQTVGPTLQSQGTQEQKDFFLPSILAGDLHFAIGYTEPEAGTDLAALRTSAVRDGEHYIVNGQKVFTTGGHDADYVWLAVRTDPPPPATPPAATPLSPGGPPTSLAGGPRPAPRHKGISILIVDTTDPGFSWTPTITADGAHHTNTTYYSDVRVPVSMRVGAENAGWQLITTQLNHERVMLGPAGRIAGLYERVHNWAAQPGTDGVAPLSQPDVLRALAETHATWRLNELLNWQVASRTADEIDIADASATKVFASERVQRVLRLMEEVIGRHGDPAEPRTAELMHWLDVQAKRNLVMTFGGGVNEIQRELIAQFGLKLPRVPR